MNLKIYEKTKYPGIWRNKNKGNYIVDISSGRKEFNTGRNRSTISTLNGQKNGPKILKISEALNIQRNPKILDMVKFSSNNSSLVEDIVEKYINWCKYNEKRAYNTIAKKISRYKNHLIPYIGKMQITKVSEKDIILIHEKLEKSDLQNESKRNIHKEISAFFNWCVLQNIIRNSPIRNIKNFPKQKKEMKYWTPEEFIKFRNYLESIDSYWSKTIHLLTTIGIALGDRIGETRVLRYNSIKNNQIEISHSINYDTSSNDKDSSTKNYQSQRLIDISNNVIEETFEYKDLISNYFPTKVTEKDYIFMNPISKLPYSDTVLRKHFYKFCDEAKVERIRLYDLRHTSVALLMSEGWELYHISERLGHKNYSTTVEKYGHLSNNTKQKIANSISKFL